MSNVSANAAGRPFGKPWATGGAVTLLATKPKTSAATGSHIRQLDLLRRDVGRPLPVAEASPPPMPPF